MVSNMISLYNTGESVATNVTISAIITEGGANIEFAPVPSVIKALTATWVNYVMKIGQTRVPPNNNLLDVLKMCTTVQSGQTTASYPVSVSFSNYGELDRWQTDFRVNCDFSQHTIVFLPGTCRKISV